MNTDEAKIALDRHFVETFDLCKVGDAHSRSFSFIFSTIEDKKSVRRIARFSQTAQNEYSAYLKISSLARQKTYQVRCPNHFLLQNEIIVRDFIEGNTLGEIERHYLACVEIGLLIFNTKSMPSNIKYKIADYINDRPIEYHEFMIRLIQLLQHWSSYDRWREAIRIHTQAPLKGEALRSPLNLMHLINCSPMNDIVNFNSNHTMFIESFILFINRLFNNEDVRKSRQILENQLDEIVKLCSHIQLYDIHYDNIVIDQNGKLWIIDLECIGIGSSQRILAHDIFFMKDIENRILFEGDYKPAWASKVQPERDSFKPFEDKNFHISGTSRVILCGTNTFQLIIKSARELIFQCSLLSVIRDIDLDIYDSDIEQFPQPWKNFQKIKRCVRGTSLPPSNIPAENWRSLLNYCFYEDSSIVSQHMLIAKEITENIRSLNFSLESIEYAIFMRIFEYIRMLPFEVMLDRRITRQDVDSALFNILSRSPNDELSLLIESTISDIFNYKIPYFSVKLFGIYYFKPGLARRVKRKIEMSEKRDSRRSEYWLVEAINRSVRDLNSCVRPSTI